MKLRMWLKSRKILITEFASLLDINRASLYLWMSGKRIPSKKIIDLISTKTSGEVSSLEDIQD